MRNLIAVAIAAAVLAGPAAAQKAVRRTASKRSLPPVSAKAVPAVPAVDQGIISGRTYRNDQFKFELTFPDTWLIPDKDFESYMKAQGFDISLKAPNSLPAGERLKMNRALQNVTVLVTAYRSMPGFADNAIVRISAEDLKANPQIKDAVDYVDAVRSSYNSMKLPADFKFSETQAELLGIKQFAYIDTESKEGKKRMYAAVKDGYALLFTISYFKEQDLETFRAVLGSGDFFLK